VDPAHSGEPFFIRATGGDRARHPINGFSASLPITRAFFKSGKWLHCGAAVIVTEPIFQTRTIMDSKLPKTKTEDAYIEIPPQGI